MRIIEQEKLISSIDDFEQLEKSLSITFPIFLKEFLLKYEGSLVKDTYYKNSPTFKEVLYLYRNEGFASIEAILEGHKERGIQGFIPFAIDSGGWDYNVSIKKASYGQVWVNKFDSGEKETMKFVASSFKEFIDGLEPEE